MYTVNDYYIAQTPKEAAELLAKSRRNRIIGGGMWMRLGNAGYGTLIDISGLGFDKIEYDEKEIRIGAMVTLRELEKFGALLQPAKLAFPGCRLFHVQRDLNQLKDLCLVDNDEVNLEIISVVEHVDVFALISSKKFDVNDVLQPESKII